jgi:wyosine [tRNA(Phe)-imidazoG37] synthetase (radical SAM superfamily)
VKHVYGPVPSRRFGLSLGVDLLPRKTCVYDYVYCQVGPTTCRTIRREDFFPVETVLADVRQALQRGPTPEVLTLAGSGEPTLYRSLGKLIDGLRALSPAKIVLLTKGSLFSDPGVAEEVRHADLLVPSLDAGDQEIFQRVNQPHPQVRFEEMLRSLREVCASHPGTVRLEVMLARDLNDSEESIARIAGLLSGIRAETIEINTPVRPAPGRSIAPCPPATLERARLAF